MDRRPSGVAQNGAAGWYNRRESDYCRELRAHEGEYRETRRRFVGALALTITLGVVLTLTGNAAMAAWFGWTATVVVALFAGINELVLRRTTRALRRDCPEHDEPRSIA